MADERDPRDVRIIDLERELNEARREIADLKKVVEELLKRQRKGKRQANQFARENGKKDGEKKKAGREPGHEGTGARRRTTLTMKWRRGSTAAPSAAARCATWRNSSSTS